MLYLIPVRLLIVASSLFRGNLHRECGREERRKKRTRTESSLGPFFRAQRPVPIAQYIQQVAVRNPILKLDQDSICFRLRWVILRSRVLLNVSIKWNLTSTLNGNAIRSCMKKNVLYQYIINLMGLLLVIAYDSRTTKYTDGKGSTQKISLFAASF